MNFLKNFEDFFFYKEHVYSMLPQYNNHLK
jgi:hypothetical protein